MNCQNCAVSTSRTTLSKLCCINRGVEESRHAGVRVVRCSISDDDKGVDFAQRVYAHGIKIIWMVGLTPAAGTPWPHAPEGFKGLWQGYPLSAIDPDRFRAGFEPMLAKLEAKGILLEAFEPGNEINWAGFNADFSLPGEGRVLGMDDLTKDPEGQRVAEGHLQYMKLLETVWRRGRDSNPRYRY
jgi:hypothetical protein